MSEFNTNPPQQDDLEKALGEIRDYQRIRAASMKARERIAEKEKDKGLKIRRLRLIGMAAVLLILITAAFFLLQKKETVDACRLFADDPQIDLLFGTKGAATAEEGGFHWAREAYYFKYYDKVISWTPDIAPGDSNYHLVNLMRGNAWLGLCNSQKAVPLLEEAMTDPTVAERARWFLALAYVGTEQQEKAIPLLKEQSRLRYKGKEAKALLEMLE
ncbi:MAG: hypothetical protein R3B47_00155 [Bacteroidia bacterium]